MVVVEDKENAEGNYSSKSLSKVPCVLFETCTIVNLYLDFNEIEALPDDIDRLKSLRCLSVLGNYLKTLPQTIGSLTKLEELYLNDNVINILPDSFCKLRNLSKLWLTGNQLETLPDDFGEIASLRIFKCDENSLYKLPKTFGLLENLVKLELSNNYIECLSDGFGMLKSLQVLNLSQNKLKSLPESFGNLPCLRVIDLSSNDIKFLPEHFQSAKCIEKMYFESNFLQALPKWICEMNSVVEFSVRNNQLQHQPLPDEFPNGCPSIKHLDMSGNFMSKLPEDMGAMKLLEFVHFGSVIGEMERRNFQNGNWLPALPDSLCNLEHLRELHVDENQISELPDNFGDLVSLEIIDICKKTRFKMLTIGLNTVNRVLFAWI